MCLSNLTRIIQNFACAMIFAIMPFTIISAQTPALPSKEVPAMQSVPKKPVTTQVADAPQAATPTKKEVIQGYLAFIATLDPTLTIEQRVAAINGYTEKTYKTKGDLTVEGLLAQGYNAYYTETNDAAPLLNTLQASGKISVSLQKYLLALNTKLLAAKTEADILLIMQGALKEIAANKYAFEKGEQARLLAFLEEKEAVADYFAKTAPAAPTKSISSACRWCLIANHIWLSPITLVEFFIGTHTSVGSNGNTTTDPLSSVIVANAICERACNVPPPPRNCRTCPSGYTFDGVNCASGITAPKGSKAFTWSGNFYYSSPGNKTCPSGGSFDGVNCYYTPIPAGYQGFIWNNMFYVKPRCN